MDDRSAKLESLRISREADAEPRAKWPWFAAAGGALALLGLGAWLFFTPADGPALAEPTAIAVDTIPPPSSSVLDAAGYVVARRKATVSSKITGRVLEVLVEEGQRVQAGEIVARLDPTNANAALMQARARVGQAEANLRSSQVALSDEQPSFNRNEGLFKRGIISSQDVETARTSYNTKRMAVLVQEQTVAVERTSLAVAQQNLDDTVVRAPFSGVVTVKAAEPGEMVSPAASGGFTRTGICTIVDMDSLEVEVDVSESFIGRVRPGLPVTVRLNAYPDWEIPAEALTVIPTADRAKATVKVRIALKIKDSRIVPEMGARVSFHDEDGEGQAP